MLLLATFEKRHFFAGFSRDTSHHKSFAGVAALEK